MTKRKVATVINQVNNFPNLSTFNNYFTYITQDLNENNSGMLTQYGVSNLVKFPGFLLRENNHL